jgi:hypothetical protein
MVFSVAPPAPMYITLGPQCCGKTTILKQNNVLDISLDDQAHVYHYVPNRLIGGNNITQQDSQIIFGKSLLERINENIELRLLLNRWNGTLSPQDFRTSVLQLYPKANQGQLAQEYLATVEGFLSQHPYPSAPQNCAIFVPQALFQKTAQNNMMCAIDRAHHLLHQAPLHQPVAWGNTNTQPRDYQKALEIASQQGRPVHFLVYGQPHEPNQPPAMPAVPFSQLLRRNLERFQRTGKYVPLGSMQLACQRVEQLVETAKFYSNSLEQGLVQQASTKDLKLVLYANRTIGKEQTLNNNNHEMMDHQHQNTRGSSQSRKRGPGSPASPCSSSSFRQPPPAQRRRRDDQDRDENCRPSQSPNNQNNNQNLAGSFHHQYHDIAASSSSWGQQQPQRRPAQF